MRFGPAILVNLCEGGQHYFLLGFRQADGRNAFNSAVCTSVRFNTMRYAHQCGLVTVLYVQYISAVRHYDTRLPLQRWPSLFFSKVPVSQPIKCLVQCGMCSSAVQYNAVYMYSSAVCMYNSVVQYGSRAVQQQCSIVRCGTLRYGTAVRCSAVLVRYVTVQYGECSAMRYCTVRYVQQCGLVQRGLQQ